MSAWVGLSGGIGSGKSTVAHLFSQLNIPVIDTDEIAHQLTAQNGLALPELCKTFGEDIIDNSGNLKRDILRKKVFSNDLLKQKLENILHPLILEEIKTKKNNTTACYGIIEIPLLAEKPIFSSLVQRILIVSSVQDIRISRVQKRSALNTQEILAIMNSQASEEERLQLADDIIENNHNFSQLQQQVEALHSFYLEYFSNEPCK